MFDIALFDEILFDGVPFDEEVRPLLVLSLKSYPQMFIAVESFLE